MGKKVRRNSKSRNTKNRNNLRRSKVRRNNSTKKARKQRRVSRKQRGGVRLSFQLKLSQIRHEDKEKIDKGVQYYRVWVNLPGFEREGKHVTSRYHKTEKGNIITVINYDDPEVECKELTILYYSEETAKTIKINEILSEIKEIPRDGCVFDNLILETASPSEGNTTLFSSLDGRKSKMFSINTTTHQDIKDKIMKDIPQNIINASPQLRDFDLSLGRRIVLNFEKLTGGEIE